jgi:N6-L-threonylcarbamoyladenine synthase
MPVTILAIESSCDDTSAAICQNGKMLSNCVANQSIHERYGGVVPELAGRAHLQNIVPVVEAALDQAGVTMKNLDAIAFTLISRTYWILLVGAVRQITALTLNIPLIAVQHMAHVLANLIDDQTRISFSMSYR